MDEAKYRQRVIASLEAIADNVSAIRSTVGVLDTIEARVSVVEMVALELRDRPHSGDD